MHRHRQGTKLSIGTPTPNNRVYVLDENLRPLPVGSSGTMWAAGAGVSAGYVNRMDLTSRKYLPDPFCQDGYAHTYLLNHRILRYVLKHDVQYW